MISNLTLLSSYLLLLAPDLVVLIKNVIYYLLLVGGEMLKSFKKLTFYLHMPQKGRFAV